jgi:hypothetical protein
MAKHKPMSVDQMPIEPEVSEIPAEVESKPVVEPDAVETPSAPAVPSGPVSPFIPEALKGDMIVVNKMAFAKLYGALLKNKAGFYLGAGAKRIMRDVLAAPSEEIQVYHEYFRHIC